MKKFLAFLICVLVTGTTFATGENVATSKAYVDTAVAQKQDAIPANDGTAQVLTNTGTPGSVGTKNIYDSTGEYAEQTGALVTAGDFNTAVQNAIDMEFTCIEWNAAGDCLLVDIQSHANLLGTPVDASYANFDTKTHIMTNTVADTRDYVDLYINLTNQLDGYGVSNSKIFWKDVYASTNKTFTFSSSDYRYLYIKHNGRRVDNRLFWAIEPHTTYTLTANVLSADPTVVGGIRIFLSLQRENYLPAGN